MSQITISSQSGARVPIPTAPAAAPSPRETNPAFAGFIDRLKRSDLATPEDWKRFVNAFHERSPDASLTDEAFLDYLVEHLLALRPRVKLVVARDGTSARVLAAVTQPDLVLVDMRLPDASGTEVLQALREQAQAARIVCIAVSANALPEDIAAARTAGFDGYLTKPLEAADFLAHIDAALARPAVARSAG